MKVMVIVKATKESEAGIMDVVGQASQATRVDGHCDFQLEARPPKTPLDTMPNKRLQATRFAGG